MSAGSIAIRVVIGIVGGVGIIVNSLAFFLLLQVKLGSHVSNFLVRSQLVIDAIAGLVLLLSKIFGDIKTSIPLLDTFLCHAWYTDHGFWTMVILSVHCMVCISVDRIINITLPVFYRKHQKVLIAVSILYCGAMCIIVITPTLFLRRFEDNQCVPNKSLNNSNTITEAIPYIWLVLLYAFPAVMSILSNLAIIRRIYKTGRPAFLWMKKGYSDEVGATAEMPDVLSQPAQDSNTQADRELRRKLLRKVALTTSIMTALFLILYAYDMFSFAFVHLDDYLADYTAVRQQLGVLFISLNCLLNPCVFIYTITPLQDKFSDLLVAILILLKCRSLVYRLEARKNIV